MTELKARVSGLKTFCTARYLRKSASRGFGWLSILKDIYSKQCRLLALLRHAIRARLCPQLGVDRKTFTRREYSGFDPSRTLVVEGLRLSRRGCQCAKSATGRDNPAGPASNGRFLPLASLRVG
jgi:hypothetical protein